MTSPTSPETSRDGTPSPESGHSGQSGPVAKALGVLPGEVGAVKGLMAAAFLLGIALVLFYSSANAIFLTRYDITVLPWVYIVNAIVVIVIGIGYSVWSRKVSTPTALVQLTGAMTLSVAGLWLWGLLSDDRVVAFVMATWFRMLFIYAVLGLWEVASAVFDIRQAKRLFASIALGMMIAFVVGGGLAPLLSPVLGTINMVGVSALFLGVYTIRFSRLLAQNRVGVSSGTAAAKTAPAGPREILGDRYSRRMVWMKTVTILLLYLTEYVFYQQAADTFDSEASLAGFFGVFMGAMTVLMVLVTGLASGRFISRFGIKVATLTLPIGMLLTTIPAGIYGITVALDTLFFVLVAITLATNHVLGNAISDPAGAVLFQPMPAEHRMRVRLAVDGWLGSIALIGAGVLLLILTAIDLDSVAPYLLLIAVVAAVGVVIAVLQYGDYVKTLHDVTSLSFGPDGASGTGGSSETDGLRAPIDPFDRTSLTEQFGSEAPGVALAAATLVRTLEHDPIGPLAETLLAHPDPQVVELALDAIADSEQKSRVGTVIQALERSELPAGTRRRAMLTLSALEPERAVRWLNEHPGPEFDEISAVVLLRSETGGPAGLSRLRALADSPELTDQLAACRTIDHCGNPDEAVLLQLLGSNTPDVVIAALDATKGRVSSEVQALVLAHAENLDLRRAAVNALANIDGDVWAEVAERFDALGMDLQVELIGQVLGGQDRHLDVFHQVLVSERPSPVRRATLDALATVGDRTVNAGKLVARDVDFACELAVLHRAAGQSSRALQAAVADEFDQARRCIYGGLALGYDRKRISDIEILIAAPDEDDRANAVEALEVTLNPERRRETVSMLEHPDVRGAADAAGSPAAAQPLPEFLSKVCNDHRLMRWTRQVASLELAELNGTHDKSEATDAYGSEPLMSETVTTVMALKAIDIFSTLPYHVLAELAALVRQDSFPAGTVIIREGDAGDELYAIVSGAVQVVGTDSVQTSLGQNTVFGELALLDPAPRSATVTAIDDVEVMVISRRTLLALTERKPTVMAEIARVLARRLRRQQ